MTQKDIELIKKAQEIDYMEWYLVSNMIKEAESAEAKEQLHIISSKLYHEEETSNSDL